MPMRHSIALASFALSLVFPAQTWAAPLGQWVWSRADVHPLELARAVRPDVDAAVQVAELRFAGAELQSTLRLSPSTVNASTVVIRFERSVHAAWTQPRESFEASAVAVIARVLSLVKRTAPAIKAVQLDYDCPTRSLARWAGLLRALRAGGALEGLELWTTSLIAQLREPSFGPLFRGLVAGHVVQVFDTGELADQAARARLAWLLKRADMPFRVGIGSFERGRGSVQLTQHERWWPVVAELASSPQFRGTWVFAAGQPWAERARSLP
jgi:hypothetical protein